MINILCVNVGTKYSPDYVYNLEYMVKNNISTPFTFRCITDRPDLYKNTIQVEKGLPGYWAKMCAFRETESCLYFDLDMIIHGPVEQFVKKDLTMIECDWKSPDKLYSTDEHPAQGITLQNGSIMSWDDRRDLYDKFMENPEANMEKYVGDDRYVQHVGHAQSYDCGLVYSYRDGADWYGDTEPFKYRKDWSVALFHGKPNIHECWDHEIVRENCSGFF